MRMRAAVYARKSNVQEGGAMRSVDRQEEGARRYCASQDWTVVDVFSDDAVSGARFDRPELRRMLAAAKAGVFEAVVLYDLARLGRNTKKTIDTLDELAEAGVRVVVFTSGQAVDLDSPMGRMWATLVCGIAEAERDEARKRTFSAKMDHARAGLVTGGTLLGYRNVRLGPRQVVREVDERTAAWVRDIYAWFAGGLSIHAIVRKLSATKRRMPARKGSDGNWSAKTVRQLLQRPLYRGVMYYARTRTAEGRALSAKRAVRDGRELPWHTTTNGNKRESVQVPQPEETWVSKEMPALRIVDAKTVARVDAILADRSQRDHGGRPPKVPGAYLLSGGMLVCPECGGNFETRSGIYYQCSNQRRKGKDVCTCALKLRIRETDEAVLAAVEGDLLSPRAVEELLASVETSDGDEPARLEAEAARLRQEVRRIWDKIAEGAPEESAVPAIREREAEVARLEARARAPRTEAPDAKRLRAALQQRTKDWREVLRSQPQLARTLLRRLLGPITLWRPEGAKDWDNAAFEPVYRTAEWREGETVRWRADVKVGVIMPEGQSGRSTSA